MVAEEVRLELLGMGMVEGERSCLCKLETSGYWAGIGRTGMKSCYKK